MNVIQIAMMAKKHWYEADPENRCNHFAESIQFIHSYIRTIFA